MIEDTVKAPEAQAPIITRVANLTCQTLRGGVFEHLFAPNLYLDNPSFRKTLVARSERVNQSALRFQF